MKPSFCFTAVSTVMNRKLLTALAVAAVAICLLLGVGMAQADPTVIKDGADPSRAIGIQNLNIDGTLYNAQFPFSTYMADIYGPFPGSFTFDNEEAAIAAMNAINDALSADGNIREVGCTECGDSEEHFLEDYFIGYGSYFEEDPDAIIPGEQGIIGLSGLVLDTTTNEWEIQYSYSVIPYDNGATWAIFTLVPEGGNGNLPPTANPGDPYTDGVVGDSITFDGSASFDPDGTIDTYEWDFGDGSLPFTSEEPIVMYTYTDPSTYHVTLTVTDNNGMPDSETTSASVIDSDDIPLADAGGPYSGSPGSPVSFDGTGSTPQDAIVTYEWNFGDSQVGEGATPNHRYDNFGEYIVTLKVTTKDGWFHMDDTTVSIGAGNLPPRADAKGPYIGRVGDSITFDGSGSSDPNGDMLTYEWHFGDRSDPITGEEPIVMHTYTEPGLYNVILIVTDYAGVKTDSDKTFAVIRPETEDNQLVCSGAVPSIESLWPPDHRFKSVQILGVTPERSSIVIDSIYQDERVGRLRDGRGVGTDSALLRAQRRPISRGGNGRVYHIGFTADDGRGNSCTGEVTVAVPLSRLIEAIDDGPDFDSTAPWRWWWQ